MTYTIGISGHVDDPEAEQQIIDSAKEFVSGLDGVTQANFSGQFQGSVGLTGAPPEEAEQAEPAPAAAGLDAEETPATKKSRSKKS